MKLNWHVPISILLALPAVHIGCVLAQSYPARPVHIVVPFAAGGAVDTAARLVGPRLADALKQPVIVDNRPGAGGNIAADSVAKSAADGYTILLTTNGHAISPAIYRKLPFDAVKDFIPVTQLLASTLILVATPGLPAASVKELIALAKSKPGALNYGSTGVGNPLHLAMELLKLSAGLDIVQVPYKGDAPLNAALMAGEVQVAVVPLLTSLPHVRSGRLRALGITNAKRATPLPDLPTVGESVPGYESSSWLGMFVPARTSREIVDLLQQETARALNLPEVKNRLNSLGYEVVASAPQEFDAKFRADIETFRKIVREARIPVQD